MQSLKTGIMSRFRPIQLFLLVMAFSLLVVGVANYYEKRGFDIPISFAISGDTLYVLEKKNNTVLVFEPSSLGKRLILRKSYVIEPDEPGRYYMPRKLISGPDGVVVKSYIYDQNSKEFVGYRFREYASFDLPPKDLLTIILKNPKDYPEIHYACDSEKRHYFVNNCRGRKNLWKIPNSGEVHIEGDIYPLSVEEMGDVNGEFSSYEDICVDSDGCIYVSSSQTGGVIMYDCRGCRIRDFGISGFADDEILAPGKIFFQDLGFGGEKLTVSSCGNRSWIQFDHDGNFVGSLNLLKLGYPFSDILTEGIFSNSSGSKLFTFDLSNRNFIYLDIYLENEKRISPPTFFSGRLKWGSDKEMRKSGTFYAVRAGRVFLICVSAAAILLLAFFFYGPVSRICTRIRIPFFLKLLLLFLPMLLASAHIIASWISDIMRRNIEDEYVRRSANLAHAILNSVSIEDLEKLKTPKDRDLPEYERIFSTVSKIIDSESVEQTPKWIIHKIHAGRFYFGINIWKGALFEPYIIPADRKMFYNVMKDKMPQWGRIRDEQGEWFSYLHPICNARGDLIYVIELYRPSESIDRIEQDVSERINKVVLLTVVIASLIVFLFSYVFTRPLKALMLGTEKVSSGDFLQHIDVRSRDELADLGNAFNRMVLDLRRHTEELKKTTEEKERMQTELRLARDIQKGMLPSVFPPFQGAEDIEIYAEMVPAKEIGGDYFDFFPVDDENFGVVIADVSGKGIPAALFMMVVRALIRNISISNPSPAQVVDRLNKLLSAENSSGSFVSIFYFVYNRPTGRLRYCNAGHLPPAILSGGKATLVEKSIRKRTGMIVGVAEEAKFSEDEIVLEKGETIVLYTDGITETVDRRNVFFGEERMLETLQDCSLLPVREICANVICAVHEYQSGHDQFDDITMLFFKRL